MKDVLFYCRRLIESELKLENFITKPVQVWAIKSYSVHCEMIKLGHMLYQNTLIGSSVDINPSISPSSYIDVLCNQI